MLRDLLPHYRGIPACSPQEQELAGSMATSMIASLEQALADGEIDVVSLSEVSAAVCHAAVELAVRLDRRAVRDQLPINDSWDDSLELECGEVGHLLGKWLRRKLPQDGPRRAKVFTLMNEKLRRQLAEECRHLRRLHMGFQQMQTMGFHQDRSSQNEEDAECDLLAMDLVDQLVMIIGNTRSKGTIVEMLGASTASSSAGPAHTLRQGTLYQESECLRRWLNDYYEGSLETLDEDNAEALGLSLADEGMEDMSSELPMAISLSAEDAASGSSTSSMDGTTVEVEPETDEVRLGQKGKGKARSRSRSRERTTWSSASSRGWNTPGGTGFAGNAHRPWRRNPPDDGGEERARSVDSRRSNRRTECRPAGRERGAPSGGPGTTSGRGRGAGGTVSSGTRTSRVELPEPMEEHAWHILMDMAEMDSNPASYQYGLTPAGVMNVHASYVGMTQHERSRMHIAFLRVMSRILMDVAAAATSAMVELREENLEVDVDADPEEHSLMQKLPAEKVAKLRKASEKVDLLGLLGSEFDKMCRSLIAALDRMPVDEAARCSQNLLMKLFQQYAIEATEEAVNLPEDAQGLMAGLVAYGADGTRGMMPGSSMDNYFVTHWWEMISSLLPLAVGSGAGVGMMGTDGTSTATAMGSNAGGCEGPAHLPDHQRRGETCERDRNGATLPEHGVPRGEQSRPTIDLDDSLHVPEVGGSRELSLPSDRRFQPTDGADQVQLVPQHPGARSEDGGVEDRAMQLAMEKVCEEHKAERYRDWELWEMQWVLGNVQTRAREVMVRGAVRHRHGGMGTSQTMAFHVCEDERVELHIQGVPSGQGRRRKRTVRNASTQSEFLD